VTVAAPTYAEHAEGWARHGHQVRHTDFAQLDGAADHCDVLVVCNPNNPTGATIAPARLLALHARLAARGGWLVVDEAFGDLAPELSVAAHTGQPGLIVLRSIGKFFGLAGLRLGFVAAHAALLDALADRLGPWMVSGPAQQVALAALRDAGWQRVAQARLAHDGARMRTLLAQHGIAASGTPLFHWWRDERAGTFQDHMARRAIWTRLFHDGAIRVGLPGNEAHWHRIEHALREWTER
jgi:cobalamin biosynthetic protein CobC